MIWRGEGLLGATHSTGRCNTLVEHLSGCLEAKRLARPLVQLSCNRIKLSLGEPREVHPLGHVLPEQPIGVLVDSALPRTLRIAEVDLDVSCYRELLAWHPHLGLKRLRFTRFGKSNDWSRTHR